MDVQIDGHIVHLSQKQLIGLGGEGSVFLAHVGQQRMAIKIYHLPTAQRKEKLTTFLARNWQLPREKIALPLALVREASQGNVIGLTMPYLDSGVREIAQLANKKQRAAMLISNREIADIFLDGAEALQQIHRNGLIVGDLNDQNVLFKQHAMLWLDVDAWQFADYACPVGTEDFLAPELYGIELGARPAFKAEHDWYAFAVHVFRSLLFVHPYGGTHKETAMLTQRAQRGLFVFNTGVTYPKIALSPALLNDELTEVFERIFARGWRGTFPIEVLRRYREDLIVCSSCTMYYPQQRGQCPQCQAKTIVAVPRLEIRQDGISVQELFKTAGKIVFAKVQDDMLSLVAYEHGQAVLYSKKPGQALKRKALFKAEAGTRFELVQNVLVINAPETTSLLLLDLAGERPVPLGDVETALFAPGRKAIFQATQSQLFTIQNNALMCNTLVEGSISGRAQRTVMEKQTWFRVAQKSKDGKPPIFGFLQVFRQQLYWLMQGHAVYDVALPPLHQAEALVEVVAYFAEQGALIRRHTQERGVDYLRTDMINYRGDVVFSAPVIKRASHPCAQLQGMAYAQGVLLHATDNGIVQERVEQGTFKTFAATQHYVQEGDTLEPYQSGLLIIGENQVNYLVMH